MKTRSLSLSLFALLSRRGGGDEEEEEQQQEGEESFTTARLVNNGKIHIRNLQFSKPPAISLLAREKNKQKSKRHPI